YVTGPGGSPIAVTRGGKTYFYHTNAHGDVTSITGTDGNPLASFTYDAWGVPTELTATGQSVPTGTWAGSPGEGLFFLFGGMLYDAATGLYLTKSRVYDPKTGRFLSRDILDESGKNGVYKGFPFGKDAIGTNLYGWCTNNPATKVDPSGQWGWDDFTSDLSSAWDAVSGAADDALSWGKDMLGDLGGDLWGGLCWVGNEASSLVSDVVGAAENAVNWAGGEGNDDGGGSSGGYSGWYGSSSYEAFQRQQAAAAAAAAYQRAKEQSGIQLQQKMQREAEAATQVAKEYEQSANVVSGDSGGDPNSSECNGLQTGIIQASGAILMEGGAGGMEAGGEMVIVGIAAAPETLGGGLIIAGVGAVIGGIGAAATWFGGKLVSRPRDYCYPNN
ncbi:MAG: RHS repeat-associated core domain-containing protein, partial [Thermoleophilia bacterium]